MRLVWALIPLILIGIVGVQESFAEQASGKPIWETNSDKVCGDKLCSEGKSWSFFDGIKQGDYFSYEICIIKNGECDYFGMDFWIEQETIYNSKPVWKIQTIIYDEKYIEGGNIKLDKNSLKPLQYSYSIVKYINFLQSTLDNSNPIELREYHEDVFETPFGGVTHGPIIPPGIGNPPMINMRVVDMDGNSLDSINVGQSVLITSDIAYQEYNQDTFVWLVQIQDLDDIVVSLSWLEGIMNAGDSFSPSMSWRFEESGQYKITTFLWHGLDDLTSISPQIVHHINVN
jgi:hypothetical protein